MSNKILENSIYCTQCQDTITSYRVHDYVRCSCGGCFVDGGTEYVRVGGAKFATLTIYEDGSHNTLRNYLRWGTRGPEGDKPLTYTILKDMSDEHLEALTTTYSDRLSERFLQAFKAEILWRSEDLEKNEIVSKVR